MGITELDEGSDIRIHHIGPRDVEMYSEMLRHVEFPAGFARIDGVALMREQLAAAEKDVPMQGIFAGNMLIGAVELVRIRDDVYEIDYVLRKEFTHKGIARRAIKDILKSFNPSATVIARVKSDNNASMRALIYAGFQKELPDSSYPDTIPFVRYPRGANVNS